VRISIADIAFYVSNAPALWVLHQLDGLRYRARQGKVSSREGFFAALRAGEGVVSAASTRPGGGAFLQVGVQNVHWLVEVHPNGAAWLDSPHTQRPVAQWLPDVHALASGELAGLAEVNNAPALVFLLPGGGQRTRPLSSADRNAYASLQSSTVVNAWLSSGGLFAVRTSLYGSGEQPPDEDALWLQLDPETARQVNAAPAHVVTRGRDGTLSIAGVATNDAQDLYLAFNHRPQNNDGNDTRLLSGVWLFRRGTQAPELLAALSLQLFGSANDGVQPGDVGEELLAQGGEAIDQH
jgi:hypothetical protein